MTVIHIPSGPELLQVVADFPHRMPARVFAHWTQQELLTRWWPQQAEIDGQLGGTYHLSWPSMEWHLRGRYLVFAPGQILAFTWKWDADEQEIGERIVHLTFQSDGAQGTRLILTHSTYADTSADQNIRLEHHLAGWHHFLAKLGESLQG